MSVPLMLRAHGRDARATIDSRAGRPCYYRLAGGTPVLLSTHGRNTRATGLSESLITEYLHHRVSDYFSILKSLHEIT